MPVTNPNHHLWRNGRLWWIAFTVIHDGWRQERVRRSLRTADLDVARRRRDDLFQEYATIPSAEVVALRTASLHADESVPFSVEPAFAARQSVPMEAESQRA
jgi:hypothetical protein